jgi:sulfur carrier protein ThiS
VKVKLEYIRPIRIENYASNSLVELPDNLTVGDLLSFLKLPVDFQRAVIVHVNGEPAWNSTILKENDSVRLYPMIAGG